MVWRKFYDKKYFENVLWTYVIEALNCDNIVGLLHTRERESCKRQVKQSLELRSDKEKSLWIISQFKSLWQFV